MARRRFKRKRRSFKKRRSMRGRRVLRRGYIRYRRTRRMGKRFRGRNFGVAAKLRQGGLSTAAWNYGQVLLNPFAPVLKGPPTIPDFHTLPSCKFYLKARGTLVANEGDIGYVVLNPYRPIGATGAAVGYAPIYASILNATPRTTPATATITGGALNQVAAPVTSASAAYYFDTTFVASDWNNNVAANGFNKFRVVGAGLKVSYASRADSREGSYTSVRIPDNSASWFARNSSVAGTVYTYPSTDQLRKFDEAKFGPVPPAGTFIELNYKPVDSDDFEYSYITERANVAAGDNEFKIPTGTAGIGNGPTMIIAVGEGNASPQTYTWEAIVWYEGIGLGMNGLTPSPCDIAGMGYCTSIYNPRAGPPC